MSNVVSDRDVEIAISTYNELTLEQGPGELSEIGRLVHNDNLFSALVGVVEAELADRIGAGDQKLAADKIKWKARSSVDYRKALVKAARAAGELASARLRVRAAENVIEIWRSQSANNRRGHI
jgi:hypothetical protein